MKCGLWRNLAKTFVKCNKIGHILFSLYGITLKRLSGLRNAPIRAVGKKKYYNEHEILFTIFKETSFLGCF